MSTKTLTPQQKLILDYLRGGHTLTNKVAMACLNVGSLSSRIAELRKMGYNIVDRIDTGHDGRSFKKYDLKED